MEREIPEEGEGSGTEGTPRRESGRTSPQGGAIGDSDLSLKDKRTERVPPPTGVSCHVIVGHFLTHLLMAQRDGETGTRSTETHSLTHRGRDLPTAFREYPSYLGYGTHHTPCPPEGSRVPER